MMMMKSVFWWRKPEYPEETTDLRQVTDETFHKKGGQDKGLLSGMGSWDGQGPWSLSADRTREGCRTSVPAVFYSLDSVSPHVHFPSCVCMSVLYGRFRMMYINHGYIQY